MVNNGFLLGKRLELASKPHTICVQLPPFHIYGTLAGIVASLHHGSTIVLPTDGYQSDKTFDAIKNEKCTVIVGTPTMFVDLTETRQKRKESISAEIAVLGGAPSSPHLLQQIIEILNIPKFHVSEVFVVLYVLT